ncbi:trehalose-phosphatase [Actinomyces minihominis]|uniref:trehalose-phosphatase n=1 Tax=Actinomyces minihominis TaxID=2002838 RepID=UPI000C078D10|nr:trehalose-phosphatase [Actinomyces minihominis]
MTDQWTARTSAGATFSRAIRRDPAQALLVFDFDGTLSHIVSDPSQARMVEASAEAMKRLAKAKVQMAIISGRPVSSLIELADAYDRRGLANAHLFGQYGAEYLNMTTGEFSKPNPKPEIIKARTDLAALSRVFPGSHVEDKGLAVALHVRNTEHPDSVYVAVEDECREIAGRYGLTVEPGRYVWELRGASVNKGDALRELISELKPAAVMFAGDDLGDIAAFEALSEIKLHGGPGSSELRSTCAVVSASPEAPDLINYADILCKGPDGVAAWLGWLASEVTRRSPRDTGLDLEQNL